MLDRVMKEGVTHARLIDEARALGDSSLEFAERSRMYRGRGLSPDTSVRVNFAIEEALRGLTSALSRGSDPVIQRAAIVGPGLDFSDKQEGYDFYAPQTIQPFAIQDTLIRHGLARPGNLEVSTFDVSPRVNAHLNGAVNRAGRGAVYRLHIPIDGAIRWTSDFFEYWRRFGVRTVGLEAPVTVPPGLGARVRAMNVSPEFVTAISPHDVNITAQYLELDEAERFDLIVGTNVFLYYDRLQQGLAMVSASRMLRPGGVLLSNNALVEIPAVGMTSVGYSKTLYSDRDEDGDLIVWYQKLR
jgi:SAM-dependent methyltransferase